MRGILARGDFTRLAYRLGRSRATGLLTVLESSGPRHALWLRRGYLTAALVEGHWAPLGELLRASGEIGDAELRASLEAMATGPVLQGRELVARGAVSQAAVDAALARQAEMRLERLAAIPSGEYTLFVSAEPSPPAASRCRPTSLATWARRHIEAQLDSLRARAFASELSGARLAVHKDLLPDQATLDEADRRILDALATPRRLDELEAAAHAPRFRLLSLLHFLRVVGALDLVGVAARPVGAAGARPQTPGQAPRPHSTTAPSPASSPRERALGMLGLRPDADATSIRHAYCQLARTLHPDLQPGLAPAARRALEERFADLTEAYRSLCN